MAVASSLQDAHSFAEGPLLAKGLVNGLEPFETLTTVPALPFGHHALIEGLDQKSGGGRDVYSRRIGQCGPNHAANHIIYLDFYLEAFSSFIRLFRAVNVRSLEN